MKEDKVVILVRGIQGAGKTYWSKQWVEEGPEHRVRLNLDDIRNMLGKYWIPTREPLVNKIFISSFKKAMEDGYDIVIDNMSNLNPKRVDFYNELITLYNNKSDKYYYGINFVDFKTPLDECLKRDATRPNPIGEKVIMDTYNRYKNFYENVDN